jgi:hypothetical protein
MAKPSNLRIEDVGASTARGDLNDILISLASLQTTDGAGTAYTGEPTTTYPNMLWYDKATSILKVRSTDDSTWLNVAYIDQSANAYRIIDDTQVVNTSGTQTGLVGDQATATWEAGVGTVESLVSPAKVAAAITALVPEGIGDGQTWQTVTRSSGVSYQNTTGKPIMVAGETQWQFSSGFEVSTNGSTWLEVLDSTENDQSNPFSIIIPNNYYYRINGTILLVRELR